MKSTCLAWLFALLMLAWCGLSRAAPVAASAISSPTACQNITGIGSQAWANPGNAMVDDTNRAEASVNDNQITNYLQCTGYSFTIPPFATITGITVTVDRNASNTLVRDNAVRLLKNGVVQATNRAITNEFFTTTYVRSDHGGSTDLWGTTWTPADINSANFGAAYAAMKDGTSGGARTVRVDQLQIRVDYTYPCDPPSNAPAGVTLNCVCDTFDRASLSPSPINNSSWLVSTSDTTGIVPSIVEWGHLRLTNNTADNAKAATIPGIYPARGNYISVEFQLSAYGGNSADGVGVTLSDYTVPAIPGAFGGSLGYAQKPGIEGFAGGWIGVGIDEYGNYQNPTESRVGGPGATPQSVSVRGSGSGTSGYPWLAGSASLGTDTINRIDWPASISTRRGPGHMYQVIVDARTETASPNTTRVAVNRDTNRDSIYQASEALVPEFVVSEKNNSQAPVPDNWQISFTGSTGTNTNIHEISSVRVCSQIASPPASGTASGFSAIDSAYGTPPSGPAAAEFQRGNIFTKLVGVPFRLNIAKMTTDGQIDTGFTDSSVYVKLVNNSDGACILDSTKSDYCNSTCRSKAAVAVVPDTDGDNSLNFQTSNAGKKLSGNVTINAAYKNLVAVMSASSNYSPGYCSTDAFSVRPAGFILSSTTPTNYTAGSGAFTLTTTTTTALYTGTPKIRALPTSPATFAGDVTRTTPANATPNTFPAATASGSGSAATGTFTYSEAGAFSLPGYNPATDASSVRGVYDGVHGGFECGSSSCPVGDKDTRKQSTWTGIDSVSWKKDCVDESYSNVINSDGKYGCLIGITNTNSFNRFYPGHFVLQDSAVTPACDATGFTYMDQPFKIKYVIEAQNAKGAVTRNYQGVLANGIVTLAAENNNEGIDRGNRILGLPVASWTQGVYGVDTDDVYFARLATGPDGPFDNLQLGVKVTDPDGYGTFRPVLQGRNMSATTTASDCGTNCDSRRIGDSGTGVAQPTTVRFGRLRLSNAHGSERLNLPIPMRAEYWNATTFVSNTLDNCTTLDADNVLLLNRQPGITADNMPADNFYIGASAVKGEGTVIFNNGVGSLKLANPVTANPPFSRRGTVDVCIDLDGSSVHDATCTAASSANLPWLQGNWRGAATHDQDPRARATFGVFKNANEFIYIREMY